MVSGVEDAQAYGVRVHLWGVEPRYGTNQAERLIWEADTTDELASAFFNGMITVTEPRHARSGDYVAGPVRDLEHAAAAVEIVAAVGDLATVEAEVTAAEDGVARAPSPAIVAAVAAPRPLMRPQGLSKTAIDLDEIVDVGEHIANKWLLTRGRDFLVDLLPGPFLPSVVDKELLVAAEQEIRRSLRPYPEARARLRDGFWSRLIREFGAPENKVG